MGERRVRGGGGGGGSGGGSWAGWEGRVREYEEEREKETYLDEEVLLLLLALGLPVELGYAIDDLLPELGLLRGTSLLRDLGSRLGSQSEGLLLPGHGRCTHHLISSRSLAHPHERSDSLDSL